MNVGKPIQVYYLPRDPKFFSTDAPYYPLVDNILFDILASVWMGVLIFIISPVWLWLTFSSRRRKMDTLVAFLQNEHPTWVGNFSGPDGHAQLLTYAPEDGNWWLSSLDTEGKFTWQKVGDL
jgi:hypothetical protein